MGLRQGVFLVGLTCGAAGFASPISVYFNHREGTSYRERFRHIQRSGDDLEFRLEEAIAGARTELFVAVQDLYLPGVAHALVNAKARGVDVRLVMENTYAKEFTYGSLAEVQALPDSYLKSSLLEKVLLLDANGDGQITDAERRARDSIRILKEGNVPFLDDTEDGSKGSGLMHHKFMVIDGARVVLSSANFTLSDIDGDLDAPESRGNANAMLVLESADLASAFREEFSYMWGDGPGKTKNSLFGVNKPFRGPREFVLSNGSRLTLSFSPASPKRTPLDQTTNGVIAAEVSKARTSVHGALFVFADQGIADALEPLGERGIDLKLLIEPTFAYRDYSELIDMFGVSMLNRFCKYETSNHPWAHPSLGSGIPHLEPGDKLHHKFAVVDHETLLFGSHNWSPSANEKNDETFIVLHDAGVAQQFEDEFSRLSVRAELGVPVWLSKKIADAEKACAAKP